MDTFSIELSEEPLKKKHVIKVRELDVMMRVMNLFADYLMFLSEKKIDFLITENPEVAIGHIRGTLQPLTLRTKIENDVKLHSGTIGRDWHQFYN